MNDMWECFWLSREGETFEMGLFTTCGTKYVVTLERENVLCTHTWI
jgi:hypothetical protein